VYVKGVNVGSIPDFPNHTLVRYDIRYRQHATEGVVEIYMNGNLILRWEGNTIFSKEKINSFFFWGQSTSSDAGNWISALLIATGDTRAMLMKPLTLTGQGAMNEWEGDYTRVVTPGKNTTGEFMWTNTPGDVTLFSFDTPPIPDGYFVGGIALTSLSSIYGDDIQATEFVQSLDGQLTTLGEAHPAEAIFRNDFFIQEVNPLTGVRYTPTEFANLELGLRAL
jgi:hypothetical protein